MPWVDPQLSKIVARMVGESHDLDAVSEELAARVRSVGAERGAGPAFQNVSVQRARGKDGVTDRQVVAEGTAAAAIEQGHVIRNQPGGPVLGWVKGMHVMRDVGLEAGGKKQRGNLTSEE